MIEKDCPSIPGAKVNSLGQIKLPECEAEMPNGGVRKYATTWVSGTKRKASKAARHEHLGIQYRGKNYKMHRLVCEAFRGPSPEGKPIVIHLNENALDNRPENLKWGTQKENLTMPEFLAYCRSRVGENSPRRKTKA